MKMTRTIKIFLFHILLSLRGIILGASKFLSLLFLGSFSIVIYFNNLHQIPMPAKIIMLTFGIMFIFVYWFYDYLLFYLKPKIFDILLIK